MGGLLISTLGTLSNRAYYLFLIIVMVWFFGVYVPLNERKKRQDGQAAAGKRPRREEKPPLRLSRPAALGLMAACAVLAAVGLILLIAAGAMSRPLPILLGALLAGAGLAGMGRAGRDLRAAPRQPVPRPGSPWTGPGWSSWSPCWRRGYSPRRSTEGSARSLWREENEKESDLPAQ